MFAANVPAALPAIFTPVPIAGFTKLIPVPAMSAIELIVLPRACCL